MPEFKVSKQQRSVIRTLAKKTRPTIFIEGPAGTGKTTVAVQRILYLLQKGEIDAHSALVLVPQRTLAQPYFDAFASAELPAGGLPQVMTTGTLSQQMVEFFWPLVAARAGFADVGTPPTFLNLEAAQYYMAHLVGPLIETGGYFSTVRIERNRLYSQIIDALTKAAVVGFEHSELGERLKSAWAGEESQRHVYDELQACATQFRAFCLQHNLLDFSLQLEVFMQHVWPLAECQQYLTRRYRHLVVDNIEEDHPATHHLLREWLPQCEMALLVYDSDAGYRRFLGADPESAYTLKDLCKRKEVFSESFVTTADLRALGNAFAGSMRRPATDGANGGDARASLTFDDQRFHPQMVDWAAEETARLVHGEGVPPGEIVLLAPFMSDALRFTLMNRLEGHDVPARSHRPSRALREEAAVRAMLTLAQVAHPGWQLTPSVFDVAYALMQTIDGLDLVRAQLLAQIVYRQGEFSRFDQINSEMQERITYVLGGRYEQLREWLAAYSENPVAELDHFFSRLFGELLSQEGFGLHNRFDAAEHAANLVDSARRFRKVIGERQVIWEKSLGQEYVEMVRAGLVANQYIRSWRLEAEDAVLVAPAYTFLMRNQPVQYQFWLNVGARGWSERLFQPLTHPYVLSGAWQPGAVWTDEHEHNVQQEALYRLVLGLMRRCRERIYMGYSELGERGYEQQGELLRALQRLLRRLPSSGEARHV